ncbi:MAG: type VI secretion system tip protein VgrG, partial [Isosphaeraceae bacterium]|nr:type VI secretion system tip protein VgrG [Isosphaeraceae bacterium]
LSELFRFLVYVGAENVTPVPFDRLLGQKVMIRLDLPGQKVRYFSGICCRIGEGGRDATFTSYHMEVVPQVWFLTRRAQSRIFQHLAVPAILKKVFEGFDVVYELRGMYYPRDFCVQYRETDFQFASRLMEEEGIYYFFRHSADGHQMVVADSPQSHPELPEPSRVEFERAEVGDQRMDRITAWEKVQELRPGKVTLWDHCFELPHKHLEAEKVIAESVPVGEVNHRLKIGRNERLELYDYPGGYAQRFDGVDPAGGDRSSDLQRIFEDNRRTAEIRMQEEALPGLLIAGGSRCRALAAGYKFTLEGHFNADGPYLLTRVEHRAELAGDYRSDMGGEFHYHNRFTCIPAAVPFRPRRVTPKPVVQGTQTAVVVGPPGEEIFTDKYGRVKVQFHWDREGRSNADSSCWVRVGSIWAGKQWGAIHIPRIGQEVIVAFEEGDPDRPIILNTSPSQRDT